MLIDEKNCLNRVNAKDLDADGGLIIPDGVKTISATAISSPVRETITSVTIPAGVKGIKPKTFEFCPNLKQVILPHTLRTIGANAFWYCPSLTTIKLPDGLQKIGRNAFYSSGLTEITIPPRIEITDSAFQHSMLAKVNFGDGMLKEIGPLTFSNCHLSGELVLPNSVQEVKTYAFNRNVDLKRVVFPKATVLIEKNVLSGIVGNVEMVINNPDTKIAVQQKEGKYTVSYNDRQIRIVVGGLIGDIEKKVAYTVEGEVDTKIGKIYFGRILDKKSYTPIELLENDGSEVYFYCTCEWGAIFSASCLQDLLLILNTKEET